MDHEYHDEQFTEQVQLSGEGPGCFQRTRRNLKRHTRLLLLALIAGVRNGVVDGGFLRVSNWLLFRRWLYLFCRFRLLPALRGSRLALQVRTGPLRRTLCRFIHRTLCRFLHRCRLGIAQGRFRYCCNRNNCEIIKSKGSREFVWNKFSRSRGAQVTTTK